MWSECRILNFNLSILKISCYNTLALIVHLHLSFSFAASRSGISHKNTQAAVINSHLRTGFVMWSTGFPLIGQAKLASAWVPSMTISSCSWPGMGSPAWCTFYLQHPPKHLHERERERERSEHLFLLENRHYFNDHSTAYLTQMEQK